MDRSSGGGLSPPPRRISGAEVAGTIFVPVENAKHLRRLPDRFDRQLGDRVTKRLKSQELTLPILFRRERFS